ncbi:hypothetical protein TNCV_1845451 [Trichonephila clavipes]|nr:hypothetical protein TNCV_1845451 [Trichonephila clavipes]
MDSSVFNTYVISYREMNLPKLSLKDFRRDISRDFVSSAFVTSRNKSQTTSRSVQIKNKMCTKNMPGVFCPPARKIQEKAMCHWQHKSLNCVCKVLLCLGKKQSCFPNYHAA